MGMVDTLSCTLTMMPDAAALPAALALAPATSLLPTALSPAATTPPTMAAPTLPTAATRKPAPGRKILAAKAAMPNTLPNVFLPILISPYF